MVLDWLGLTDPAGAPGSAVDVAARQGATRQAVQSMVAELRRRCAVLPPPPALVQALTLTGDGPPVRSARDVAARLVTAGLAVGPVHPAVPTRAATLFGLPTGFAVRGPSAAPVVVATSRLHRYDRLPAVARTAARRRGVVRLAGIGTGLPTPAIELALTGLPGLVIHRGWYWLSPDVSPLDRVLHRLLTVCGPLPVDEILAGAARATRHSPASTAGTPTERMGAYLASQPAYRRTGDRIELIEPDTARLTTTDRALAGAFAASATSEVPTGQLVQALTQAGLAPSGAYSLIAFSPLLRQARPGRQQLRTGTGR